MAAWGGRGARRPDPERPERRRAPVRGGAFIDESTPRVAFLARDGALVSTPTGGTGILESLTVAAILEAARADGVTMSDVIARLTRPFL